MTSIKQAISIARGHVSLPVRYLGQLSYTYCAPYYADKPCGPIIECRARSRIAALAKRRVCVARIALHLLDRATPKAVEAIEYAAYSGKDCGSVESILRQALGA